MIGFKLTRWVLGSGLLPLLAPVSLAQDPAAPKPLELTWEIPPSHQAFVPRSYQSDGTNPAASKGKFLVEVQPVVFETPLARIAGMPTLPHGFRDPTHPAGLAEPGSAAPAAKSPKVNVRPVTSGYAFPIRQN